MNELKPTTPTGVLLEENKRLRADLAAALKALNDLAAASVPIAERDQIRADLAAEKEYRRQEVEAAQGNFNFLHAENLRLREALVMALEEIEHFAKEYRCARQVLAAIDAVLKGDNHMNAIERLRRYLAGDPVSIMSRAHVEEIIAEIEHKDAEITAIREMNRRLTDALDEQQKINASLLAGAPGNVQRAEYMTTGATIETTLKKNI